MVLVGQLYIGVLLFSAIFTLTYFDDLCSSGRWALFYYWCAQAFATFIIACVYLSMKG